MISTLEKKPSEAFPTLDSFLEELRTLGFQPKVSSMDSLSKAWTYLENPRSSDFPEASARDYCYTTKRESLEGSWGLVFRSLKGSSVAGPREILLENPDAAVDHLLRKTRRPEWFGDQENFLSRYDVRSEPGVVMGPDCLVGKDVCLESGVRIGARVQIGSGTRIGAGSRIADDTIIGDRCYLRGPVSLGGQGFGFVPYPKSPVPRHRAHVGRVIVGDDVQLGSFVTIDRGVFEDTVLGPASATDNFVHIGHNCRVGKHAILCGFVGLSGSTIMGDFVTLGGLVVSKGHLKVGNRVQVGGFSAIYEDVPDGSQLRGIPARPIRRDLKIMAIQEKLPELYEMLKPILKETQSASSP